MLLIIFLIKLSSIFVKDQRREKNVNKDRRKEFYYIYIIQAVITMLL